MSNIYLRIFFYIGIFVFDLEKVVVFYIEVLGWYLIMLLILIMEDDLFIGEMCIDVFGKGWQYFKIVYFFIGDRIGVEIFQFD